MTERLNIRQFTGVERREPFVPFDPEQEITEKDVQTVRQIMDFGYATESWSSYLALDMYLSELKNYSWSLGDYKKEKAIFTLTAHRDEKHWGAFLELAFRLHEVDELSRLGIALKEQIRAWYLATLEEDSTQWTWHASRMKALGIDFEFTAEDREKGRERLEKVRSGATVRVFIEEAAKLKILGLLDLDSITTVDWERMTDYLRSLQKDLSNTDKEIECDAWKDYLRTASLLKIIGAESVTCSEEKGLIIGPPATISVREQSVPSVPESSRISP